MIFKNGDRILFKEEKKCECIICDDNIAVFGHLKDAEEGKIVNYDNLFAVSNDKCFEDAISYEWL